MDHDDRGLRRLLTLPQVYDAFQTLIGGDSYRRWLVATQMQPQAGWRVLDIGCGPATMLRFLPRDVLYLGFDMNERYIAYAQRKFGSRGQFFASRVESAQVAAGGCDVVMANAILHHLNDAEAAQLIDIAWQQLKPGGFFLSYDNAWVPEQSRAARLLIGRDRGRHVRAPDQYLALVGARFADVQTTVRHDGYRIPYTLFSMKAYKTADA